MTFSEFQSLFDNAKEKTFKGGRGFIARCPVCASHGRDTKGEHLSAYPGADDWIKVSCVLKTCSDDEIMKALNLSPDDRRIRPYEPGKDVDNLPIHIYENLSGYVAEKQRKKHLDGSKFFQWRVKFKNGVPTEKVEYETANHKIYKDWPTPAKASLNGEMHILYRLPQLRKAIDAGKTIYVGEGESASDAAWKKGIMHTCQGHGAGRGKWLPEYTAQLKGAKEIVIIADRDVETAKDPYKGPSYSKDVFVLLRAAGLNVRVAYSKTTGEGDDFRDHLEAGYSESELIPAHDLMPPRGVALRRTDPTARPVVTTHVLDPIFPRGATVLLDGKGGTKKTFFMVCVAAALSVGWDPISERQLDRPMKVLFVHKGGTENEPGGGDNTDEKLNTIYRANGGKGDLLCADVERFDEAGITQLTETIIDNQIDLVVIDYLFLYLHGVVTNVNDPIQATPVCQRLLRAAKQSNSTWVALRHMSMSKGGIKDTRDPSEMGSGTNQWHDAMRGHLVFRKHTEEPYRALGVIVITDEKGDLLNEQSDAILFSRRGDEMFYERSVPNPFGGEVVKSQKGKLGECETWLTVNLTGQLMNVLTVNERLKALGMSPATIRRARAATNVKAVKSSAEGGWWLTIEQVDPFAD